MAVTGPYSNANYNQNALNFFAQNNGVSPSQVTYVPGVGYQVLGQTNNAASQFQPTYQTGQQATGGGVNPSPLNPVNYASPQTAQQLAGLLGGTVAPDTAMGTGQGASVNIPTPNGIQLPNGQMVDAGTIANLFQRGYSPEALAQQLQSQSGGAISGITPQQIAQLEGAPAPGAGATTAAQAAGMAPGAGALSRGTTGGVPIGAQGGRLQSQASLPGIQTPGGTYGMAAGSSPYASAGPPAAWGANPYGTGGTYAGQGGNPFQIGGGMAAPGVATGASGFPAMQPRDTSTGQAAGNTSILADILGFFGIGQGANALQQAAYAGEQGTLGAAKTGTGIITDTLNRNSNALQAAQNSAINDVGQYGNFSQNLLSGNLSASMANDYPFINQGQQGINALGNYAANLPQFGMSPYAQNASPTGGSSPNIPGVAPDPRAVLPGGAGAAGGAGGGPPQFSFNPTAYQLAQTPGYQFALQQGENAIQNQSSAGGGGIGSNQDLTAAKYATGLAGQQYEQAFQNAAQGFGLNQAAYNQAYQNSLQGFQANQGLNLQALGMLQNAGLQGVGQENQALLGFGLPAAQYLYNTGLFGGNAIENTALANAQQGLQGMQYEAGMLLPAAEQAGAFALEGAGANAAGILGQNNNLAGIGQSLGGLALGFLGM